MKHRSLLHPAFGNISGHGKRKGALRTTTADEPTSTTPASKPSRPDHLKAVK